MNEIQKTEGNLPSKKSFAISKRQQVKEEIKSEIKIRDIEGDEEIKQALRYVFTLIGLKPDQIPGDIEKIVLIQYIKDNFKSYTPNEIKIAFELAIKGDFNTELNHYGSFSALYMSRIFNDYIEHRRQLVSEVMREKAEIERKKREEYMNRPEVIEEQNRRFDLNVIQKLFEVFQDTGKLDFGLLPPSVVYKALKKRHGLFDLSKDDQTRIMNEARKKTESEIKHRLERFGTREDNEFRKTMKDALKGDEKRDQIFQRHCHLIAIEELFQGLVDQNDDLKNHFKNQNE